MDNGRARPGDSNAITREYIDSLLVEMRHIGAVMPDTSFLLYGERFEAPIMTAALSHMHRTHPNGMAELGKAAFAQNAVMWCGMGSEQELEQIIATGARTIKIIKPYEDNDVILRKIQHAERAGAMAVGMDLDHAFNPNGGFDEIDGLKMAPKSIEEFGSFVKATKLPFILKGVLSEQDARICLELGVQGMVISHHHGRTDCAVPPLMILPRIAKLVDGKMPLFVDCGLQSGLDVFKALALGATAVSVGNPLGKALKQGGAEAVQQVLQDMTNQLRYTMGLTASKDLKSIDPSIIHHS